ncbi:MAG: Tyrosine-specific transport protein [Chlamydiia bacterium]|nr:Tyrosine-specific transport protein [Chlamydiia bacterium]MCH9618298.1 Tyrosine-specific transport protein [Chlamydiia bacterium]MCH9624171.1 Tyrosine-specific transport protein [Chlamydiia bacterium]
MNASKVAGGTLLVSGTTIGAGLLGLPATCAFMGFYPSILLFFICWLFMLAAGIFFVDISCDIKKKANIITMAEKTIGKWGMAVSWISYLLLLYSLMALYLTGSAVIFKDAMEILFGISLPSFAASFILPLLFGWLIYLGTYGVDMVNRYLMAALVLSYVLLVSFLPSHIQMENLQHYAFIPAIYALPFVITAFGYHIIIPTLGSYMKYDRKMMIYSVVIGSVIALVINTLWQFLVLGVVPLDTLAIAWKADTPITPALAKMVTSNVLGIGVYLFSIFAILTSFLGVALSLSDFLIDGFKIKKGWEGRLLAIALTFVPPLLFISTYGNGFLLALGYAGAFVAILLLFIPSMMVWKLKGHTFYQSTMGHTLMITTVIFAGCIVTVNILNRWGFFTKILEKIGGL